MNFFLSLGARVCCQSKQRGTFYPSLTGLQDDYLVGPNNLIELNFTLYITNSLKSQKF